MPMKKCLHNVITSGPSVEILEVTTDTELTFHMHVSTFRTKANQNIL